MAEPLRFESCLEFGGSGGGSAEPLIGLQSGDHRGYEPHRRIKRRTSKLLPRHRVINAPCIPIENERWSLQYRFMFSASSI